MEPFVPTPDERISHKDAASGKGRQGNGNQPPTPPGESGGWRRHLPLLAVTLVFVLLLAMSHSVNRGKIGDLSQQLDELATAQPAPAPTPAADPEPPSGDIASRMQALENRLNDQVSELETMRQMVAETLSKLDGDLEGSLMGYYQRNAKAIEGLRAEVAKLAGVVSQGPDEARLVKLEARLGELESVPKAIAELSRDTEQLAANLDTVKGAGGDSTRTLARLEAAVADQGKALAGLQAGGKTTAEALAAVEGIKTQLESRVTAAQLQGQTAPLAQTLAEVREQLADQQRKVAALDQNADTLAQQVVSSATGLQTLAGDIQNLVTREQLAAHKAELDKALTLVRKQLAQLDTQVQQSVAQLTAQNGDIRQLRNGLTTAAAVATQPQGDPAAELRQQLTAQVAAVDRLKVANADLVKEMTATKGQLAALKADLQQVQARSTTGGASVASDLAPLENQISTLSAKVSAQENQVASWRREIDDRLATTSLTIQSLAAQGAAAGAALDDAELYKIRETLKVLKKQHPYTDFPK